jgi:capsid protein
MDTEQFDAAAIVKNKPWIDRALENVAPTWALRRLESRVQKHLFEYNAARTNRLYAPKQYGQPAESRQNQRDRVIMMWEARDLVENFPEAREISRKFGNYLTPHEYSPTTGDRGYNQIISEYFHAWCKNCDVTNRHSFKKLVQLAAEERPVDGDCGFVIRRGEGGLKLQLVPATRIGNPNMAAVESDNYYQGIITNDFGQPVAYRIFRVDRNGVYFGAEDIPANQFCHYFDPFRVDQYRGITDLHAAIQTARMLHDILQAEKAGVRFSSQQAALIFNERGTANPRNLFQPNPALSLPSGQQQKNELTEVGMIRYFSNSDRVEVMPARPSQAFEGFVQHLMHEIALGVGVPEGVLFGTQDYKGPSVRAEFAAADRVFAKHQGVLTDKVLDPIKDAVILDAIARSEIPPPTLLSGETMVQALRRATRGEWRFPAKLSIDVGRESAANMNENRQGAKSLQEIAAEEGTDAFARLEQIAIEAEFVKELASKYGVPETAIRLTTNSLPSTPTAAAASGDAVGKAAADAQAASVAPQTGGPESVGGQAPGEEIVPGNAFDDSPLITINLETGSYIPTNAMAENARRALEVREKKPASQRGMTSVGIARARDLINKRPMSEDTVRRMKAFFDRHEIDKQGETWDEQGKGWQAWQGWGGDAGYSWSTAIVELLNKQADKKDMSDGGAELRHQLSRASAAPAAALGAEDWLDAVQKYRAKQQVAVEQKLISIDELKQTVTGDKGIIELSKKQYELPKPTADETHDEFMARCMADPVSVAEFPDAEQRNAVCMRQHEGMFAKVGERGAIVGSDKAPKSDTPNPDPKGEGTAKGDASTTRGAEVTAEQEATLQKKSDDFNEKDSNTRNGRATLGALKSVFQRGLGAFNTSSSPRVTSASQWAFARVNAFLYLLKNGRPENPKYTTDNDLLPAKHPKSGK